MIPRRLVVAGAGQSAGSNSGLISSALGSRVQGAAIVDLRHPRKSEFREVAVMVLLGGLAAFTVFLRWQVVPL